MVCCGEMIRMGQSPDWISLRTEMFLGSDFSVPFRVGLGRRLAWVIFTITASSERQSWSQDDFRRAGGSHYYFRLR